MNARFPANCYRSTVATMIFITTDLSPPSFPCCSTAAQIGVLRVPLREVRGSPGSVLVGSWRLSNSQAEAEIAMELVWWESSSGRRHQTGMPAAEGMSPETSAELGEAQSLAHSRRTLSRMTFAAPSAVR